jgi:hypothetical protein
MKMISVQGSIPIPLVDQLGPWIELIFFLLAIFCQVPRRFAPPGAWLVSLPLGGRNAWRCLVRSLLVVVALHRAAAFRSVRIM